MMLAFKLNKYYFCIT